MRRSKLIALPNGVYYPAPHCTARCTDKAPYATKLLRKQNPLSRKPHGDEILIQQNFVSRYDKNSHCKKFFFDKASYDVTELN